MSDKLVKLLFAPKSCRAEVLHLDDAWQSMIGNQNLPACVKNLLGEMTAGAIMLAASLKFDGSLVLQLQGDGPVKLAIVEVRSGLMTRATAQLRVPAEQIPADASFKDLVNTKGLGRCALILDMAGRAQGEQPYQGVVALDADSVAGVIENYMTRSEQIRTRLWLFAGTQAIGGVLLQHVASTGGKDMGEVNEQGFDDLVVYADTVKAEEILTLDANDVAMRLFWEDNPQVLEVLEPKFRCRCSKAVVESMVKSLGKEEAKSIIEERGNIEVCCEFCGSRYILDSIDVERMFSNDTWIEPTKTVH